MQLQFFHFKFKAGWFLLLVFQTNSETSQSIFNETDAFVIVASAAHFLFYKKRLHILSHWTQFGDKVQMKEEEKTQVR